MCPRVGCSCWSLWRTFILRVCLPSYILPHSSPSKSSGYQSWGTRWWYSSGIEQYCPTGRHRQQSGTEPAWAFPQSWGTYLGDWTRWWRGVPAWGREQPGHAGMESSWSCRPALSDTCVRERALVEAVGWTRVHCKSWLFVESFHVRWLRYAVAESPHHCMA